MVENGRSDITIGRLIRLMHFYGVSLADLLPDTQRSDPDIVQAHERPRLASSTEGMDAYMLGPETERGMIPTLLTFEPGAGRKDHARHAGQEFLFVLEGELILELEGSAPSKLKAGDAACYPGARPHLLRNGSKRKALRLICVDSPSSD
jgi:quercetin dioxygenase-like cupin family protein